MATEYYRTLPLLIIGHYLSRLLAGPSGLIIPPQFFEPLVEDEEIE